MQTTSRSNSVAPSIVHWTRVGPPEAREDGSTLERFVGSNGATREILRLAPPSAAVLLFAAPTMRGWTGGAGVPFRERIVFNGNATLTVRDAYSARRWQREADGSISEVGLHVDPVLGAPRPVRIARQLPDGTDNPRWTDLDRQLSTPL